MRKFLPIILAVAVYLTPLYPVYAQNGITPRDDGLKSPSYASSSASAPGRLKTPIIKEAIKDKIASRAGELRKKLAKFKDKNKAARVENINNNLNLVNERRTAQMKKALTSISELLDKLKSKTEQADSNGKDMTSANNAISDVQAAWEEADIAVKAQMEMDYSIEVNSESTVKEDATLARNALRTDLKSVHTKIVGVRQSLAKAIQIALSSLKGGNDGSE